jgi:superfamily I DNA/RNA helicase
MESEQLIFGPPGCGKTYTMMKIIEQELEDGTPPDRIGFVSFTRKAIAEARDRAGANFNLIPKDTPFFRTLHSMGFYWLGMKQEDVVSKYDMGQLGQELGISFDSHSVYDEDGLLIASSSEGNRYLTLIQRATMRMVSLEQEFNENADYRLEFAVMEKINAAYKAMKGERGKVDFTDMIELMVKEGRGPRLDVLIVDEAQDLTPLQWEQVKVLRSNAKRVYYAGDDDQAIFEYTGVDVVHLLGVTDNKRILEQSYRVPRSVHKLAGRIASQISQRQEKLWKPAAHEGTINYHSHILHIDDIDEGSWTVMSRTSKQLNEISHYLKVSGQLFSRNGTLSFDPDKVKAMKVWDRLQDGNMISVQDAEDLYAVLPKRGDHARVKHGMAKTLKDCDPAKPLTISALIEDHGLLAHKEMPRDVLLNLSEDDSRYLDAIESRGHSLFDKPRIKLSTIHRMKGGEDDNIVLLNDMGYMSWKNYAEGNPDGEHRVFYTAVTRTKHNLHIVQNADKYGYPL